MLHTTRRHTLLALCLAGTAAAPSLAQNLTTNSGFDTSLAGWLVSPGTAEWSTPDAASQPTSGSLRLTNSNSGPDTGVVALRCVAVEPDTQYDVSVDFLVPAGQARSGYAYLTVSFYTDESCSTLSALGAGFSSVSTRGSWQRRTGSLFTFGGARWAGLAPVAVKNESGGEFVVHADNVLIGRQGTLPRCVTDAFTLCLQGGRFAVTAGWETSEGFTGPGRAVPVTSDTGYFWFFAAGNVEVVVKLIDACVPPYDRYWAFASGLTNVFVRLLITDTVTGAQRYYDNPQGRSFEPILDTDAFATCY
jgi:hypothetical protein